jgi:thymidylate synthase ThyX
MSILSNYITNENSNIFCLTNLPEEVVAVLFAYYSRSTGSIKNHLNTMIQENILCEEPNWNEILEKINDVKLKNWLKRKNFKTNEKTSKFHEKYVLSYGHQSVAEHASIHVAIEDVSILAAKEIEDCRLASYTEKSSRYVQYKDINYHIPDSLEDEYVNTINLMLYNYNVVSDILREKFAKEFPNEKSYQINTRALDVSRYMLPTAIYTNLGLSCNARTMATLITKLLSSRLPEVINIGVKLKEETLKICPTLIKYVEPNQYRINSNKNNYSNFTTEQITTNKAITIESPINFTPSKLMSYILYEKFGFQNSINDEDSIKELKKSFKYKNDFDQIERAFELFNFITEIIIDFGAYRDIQRHRMTTQLSHPLTLQYGYEIPHCIKEYNVKEYFQTMSLAKEFYDKIEDKYQAQYILPLAYRKKVLFSWNLREIYHFIKLRSKRNGHESYRKIAQEIYKDLINQYSFLDNVLECEI